MNSEYTVVEAKEEKDILSQEEALEVLEGLTKEPKKLPSKFFYDEKGSRLFQQITELEEYYPSSCEFSILEGSKKRIAEHLSDEAFNLIELGPGYGGKTSILLDHFRQENMEFDYIPIDISEGAMKVLQGSLEEKYEDEDFNMRGLVAEYFDGLKWLVNHSQKRNLVLFLGSNIGNFSTAETKRFLQNLWYSLNPGDYVMIGFDLKKDPDVLHLAYNDPQGITKEFNLNLLDRINNELGGNFDLRNYKFQAIFNQKTSAVESFIISTIEQTVYLESLEKYFSFKAWEAIQTEHSYKFQQEEIEELAGNNGYSVVEHLTDSRGYFIDSIWKVRKPVNGRVDSR